MLFITLSSLKPTTIAHLQKKQKEVDDMPTFEEKVEKAFDLWNNKSVTATENIRNVLKSATHQEGICQYCERNIGTDLEHIYPKKIFPERAFVWGNYLLACSTCNSTHKSDHFEVFNPAGSAITKYITPPRGVYRQPETDDGVFINPREENPLEYIRLNLGTHQLEPIHAVGTREYEKARATIQYLGLTGEALRKNREQARMDYASRLRQYDSVNQATTFIEIRHAIGDFPAVNDALDFFEEQQRLLSSLRGYILSNNHPTVFKEIQRYHRESWLIRIAPELDEILTRNPEIATW